jgi:hypothetical protein
VEPARRNPLFASRRGSRIAAIVVAFFWLWMIGLNIYGAWDGWHQYGGGRQKPELYGIWEVDQFTRDGQLRPPLLTDKDRFRRVLFDFPGSVLFYPMTDAAIRYSAAIDTKSKTLTLTKADDKNFKSILNYDRPSPNQLTLAGSMDGHPLQVQLERVDQTKYQGLNRGFRWIQEYPFNR